MTRPVKHDDAMAVTRKRLAQELIPRAERVARAIARRLPSHVDRDDILGAAYLGLAEALSRVGTEQQASFEAYALQRTRGAIADSLRTEDVLTRTERAKVRRLERVTRNLTAGLGRLPSQEEVAEAADISRDACAELLATASRRLSSAPVDDELSHEDALTCNETPEALLGERRALERLDDQRNRLPARLQSVLSLYYESDLTLREIGDQLGVSEARISQLRKQAVTQLRLEVAAA